MAGVDDGCGEFDAAHVKMGGQCGGDPLNHFGVVCDRGGLVLGAEGFVVELGFVFCQDDIARQGVSGFQTGQDALRYLAGDLMVARGHGCVF